MIKYSDIKNNILGESDDKSIYHKDTDDHAKVHKEMLDRIHKHLPHIGANLVKHSESKHYPIGSEHSYGHAHKPTGNAAVDHHMPNIRTHVNFTHHKHDNGTIKGHITLSHGKSSSNSKVSETHFFQRHPDGKMTIEKNSYTSKTKEI